MIKAIPGDLLNWHELPLNPHQAAAWWLGQAGFLFRSKEYRFVVDPYLSDSLAIKYRDKKFKHQRRMPIPIQPSELQGLNAVFATHKHTDHMDGGTLPGLIAANPGCRFFAPKSSREQASLVCGDRDNATFVDAGDHLELSPELEVDVIASAHEDLAYDDAGHAVFLGYIFTMNGTRIYHSGDCVPYDGLAEKLKRFDIDTALLPVNGRDEYRRDHGIPGNFHFEEAVELCLQAGIQNLVPHHFGMFDFNTVDPEDLARKIGAIKNTLNVIVPQRNRVFIIERNPQQ